MRIYKTFNAGALLTLTGFAAAASSDCPLLGPDVPAPRQLSTSSTFHDAMINLTQAIESALKNLPSDETSFSIDIFSANEDESLYHYYWNGPGLGNSTDGVMTVDDNSVFRLGSISKFLTVYVGLLYNGMKSWNDPVTDHIPELAAYVAGHNPSDSPLDTIDWETVTVGDLAAQLGGMPRDMAGGILEDKPLREQLPGLPMVPPVPSNITDDGCHSDGNPPCNRTAFFQNLLLRDPVLSVASQPKYSNLAYSLFAIATENIAGTPFPMLFDELLAKPLNLTATLYSAQHPGSIAFSNGVIPHNDTYAAFSEDLRDEIPAGGYYTNTRDMRLIGQSVLRSTLLPRDVTNRWLKPLSFTSDIRQSVGAPWEIFTYMFPENATETSYGRRKIDQYTKSGAVGKYNTELVYIPDYDVGFTLLSAGGTSAGISSQLSNLVSAAVIPVLEQVGHQEAHTRYAGSYQGNNITGSSITLSTTNGPGLLLNNFTYNGFDTFNLYGVFFAGLPNATSNDVQMRLYPTGLTSKDGTMEGWRAIGYSNAFRENPEVSSGPVFSDCYGWSTVDISHYGGRAIDEFWIKLDKISGNAVSIEPRLWQETYSRV